MKHQWIMNWQTPFIISCKPAQACDFDLCREAEGFSGSCMARPMTGFLFTWGWGLEALMKVDMNLQNTISKRTKCYFPTLIVLWSSAPGWQVGQNRLWTHRCEGWSVGLKGWTWRFCWGNFLLLKASTSCFVFVILLFWLRLFLFLATCVDLRDLVWTHCKTIDHVSPTIVGIWAMLLLYSKQYLK